jgi:hypothetical protein
MITTLFFFIFLSQIFLISYYYPNKIITRINFVIEQYPPEQYAKLYPESVDKLNQGKKIFQLINNIIILIGLGSMVLYGMLASEYSDNQKHAEGLPLMFGMLQALPFMMLEMKGFKQLRLMRKADKRSNRTADLSPRRLFNFVSPMWLLLAVMLFISYIGFELVISQFNLTSDFLIKIASLCLCNILFIFLANKLLSGKKCDPHQSTKDRLKHIELSLRSMVAVSIIASVFIFALSAIDYYQLNNIEIILNSLYWQVIVFVGIGAMLRKMQVDDIDFDVYKTDITNT